MTEHYSKQTVSVSAYCSKCKRHTQHRVDDHRKGPCLECVAKLDVAHAEKEIEARRAARQQSLFSQSF
jgi:ribosomal protein L44E